MQHAVPRFSWLSYAVPLVAFVAGAALTAVTERSSESPFTTLAGTASFVLLTATVLATMQHAERVSRQFGRVGGTLAFTVAANAVEVSIIAFMMLHKENNPTLARDTVFGIVMVTCTGVVGACLVVGAARHRQQEVDSQTTSAYLGLLATLVTVFLVLPSFLPPRSEWRQHAREVISAVISLALYGLFLVIRVHGDRETAAHGSPASRIGSDPAPGSVLLSSVFALLGLAGIVLLAKEVAGDLEDGLQSLGLTSTDAVVGTVVATLVLLPEGLDALRAATRRSVQQSLDIALGAALASIGLLIPSIVLIGAVTGREVILGVDEPGIVMLALTLVLSIISFGSGRTNVLTGAVHLVVFAMFVLMLFA